MLKSTLPTSGIIVTEKNIDSQFLLRMVNDARKKCNEPEVRNNKFIEKVLDELEGEHYTKSVVQKVNGTEKTVITMTIKQALRVAARESKAVRRTLVDKLEDMQSVSLPTKSNSGLPEYRKAKAEQLKAQALEKNISSARDLMAMFPRLGEAANQVIVATLVNPIVGIDIVPLPALEQHYYTAKEIGEMLGVSANKVGRLANSNNLKNENFGKFFLDKSANSSKQVEAFRYNSEGVKALKSIIQPVSIT